MGSYVYLILLLFSICEITQQQQQQQLSENQNYLNYQQQPQGRFLSSFPQQNNRNGFFPIARQQQNEQSGSYQQQDLYLDGPSTSSFFPFQSFATTRSPNLFEISPRPFAATSSPVQNRNQFSSFGQSSERQNGFQYNVNSNFPSLPVQQQTQRQNPYLDTTGFGEIPLLDEYEERQQFDRPRGRLSVQRNSNENLDRFTTLNPILSSIKSNRDKLRENLRGRPLPVTTSETPVTARQFRDQQSKKSRYTPITRSTTPKISQTNGDYEYNDQKFSFSKNNKVKSPSRDLSVRPLNEYRVNITHDQNEARKSNSLAVKSLDSPSRKPQSQEVEEIDDGEYEEYDDDDYGVILTEEERILKETTKSTAPQITTTTTTSPAPQTTTESSKPEGHTVIIFENFILPKKEESSEKEPEEYEYVYEDEEEPEFSTDSPVTTTTTTTPAPPLERKTSEKPEHFDVTTYRDPNGILSKAVVSVVTSKTVVNGSVPQNHKEIDDAPIETTTEEENYPSSTKPTLPEKPTTENWVVVASVQTSRSVSGAHFLPFPHVEQQEKKKIFAELNKKANIKEQPRTTEETAHTTQISEIENISSEIEDDESDDEDETENYPSREVTTKSSLKDSSTTLATTLKYAPLPSTESIIDKLDREQSNLFLGVLSGEYPVLKDPSAKKSKPVAAKQTTDNPVDENSTLIEVTTTVKPLVLIRKFQPKSTIATTQRTTTTQKVYVKHSSSTTESPVTTTAEPEPTIKITSTTPESNQRENKKISFDNTDPDELSGLLPPGYKSRNSYKNKKIHTTTTTTQAPPSKEEPLPGKSRNQTISRSYKSHSSSQDVNVPSLKGFKNKDKFASLKSEQSNDTDDPPKKLLNKLFESSSDDIDLNKFLPPDFKEKLNASEKLTVIPLENDDSSKLLPPGYKPGTTTKKVTTTTSKPSIKIIDDEISKFLPPGYKPPADEEEVKKPDLSELLNKIKFKDVSNLLPPGFKEESSASETPASVQSSTTEMTETTKAAGGKLVFPRGPSWKKPGSGRITTPKPLHAEGPKAPELAIRKGPPTRATTEFTGWPTVATTPLSIERLLELQKNAKEISIYDLLPASTTTVTEAPSTTTTTTTTTQRPTEPSICRSECNLAGTIRIIEGVEWSPELLDHNTDEWQKLAENMRDDLNEVFSNAPNLNEWFKSVRIDGFSKGSVLVDYFVELADISNEVNTLEIRRLFHEALEPAPNNDTDFEDDDVISQRITKEAFKLGNFLLDPVSTDFIVIPKPIVRHINEEDEDDLLPQWAIAMISIGFLSLVCVILFGVAVLLNRKKAAKKKATPLTADMLNELNKNHMGGLENYGAEDLYNLDDTWDERRQEIKPKRFTNSVHGSNPNIYDSWRSQHLQRYNPDEFYYDSHDPYNDLQPKAYQYSQQQQQQNYGSTNRFMEPNWDEAGYPYHVSNSQKQHSSSRKHYRDYDQHF